MARYNVGRIFVEEADRELIISDELSIRIRQSRADINGNYQFINGKGETTSGRIIMKGYELSQENDVVEDNFRVTRIPGLGVIISSC